MMWTAGIANDSVVRANHSDRHGVSSGVKAMKSIRVTTTVIVLAAIALAGHTKAQSPEQQARRDAADVARLVEALEIRAGSVVADIGAGSGELSVLLSPIVGPSGRVFATDVNKDRVAEIKAAVAKAELANVTVLDGDANRTNLSDGCCDAIFMRLVYHHFGDPSRMNQSLWQGLKPGGRLAIVDFPPTSKQSAPAGKRNEGDFHGVTPGTVLEELKAAGFDNPREEPWSSPPGFLILADKKR
jgi:protein-L-isoaspartate O-methyltransferase